MAVIPMSPVFDQGVYQYVAPSYGLIGNRKLGAKEAARNWFEDGGLLYDQGGNIVGRVTNMEMQHSLGGPSTIRGNFEGIDATSALTIRQQENTMSADNDLDQIRRRLVEGCVRNPDELLVELTELTELTRSLAARQKKERKRAKRARKAEQKGQLKKARRRELALATLEEGTHKPLSPCRINAAQALLDRL